MAYFLGHPVCLGFVGIASFPEYSIADFADMFTNDVNDVDDVDLHYVSLKCCRYACFTSRLAADKPRKQASVIF